MVVPKHYFMTNRDPVSIERLPTSSRACANPRLRGRGERGSAEFQCGLVDFVGWLNRTVILAAGRALRSDDQR